MSNGLQIGFNFQFFAPEDLKKIEALMLEIIDRRFTQGKDASGQPFDAYSESYKAQLRKEGRDTQPDMVRTGAFRRSWAVETSDKDNSTTLTLVPKGSQAQLKGWASANKARPVAGLSKAEVAEIMELALKLMRARLKGGMK